MLHKIVAVFWLHSNCTQPALKLHSCCFTTAVLAILSAVFLQYFGSFLYIMKLVGIGKTYFFFWRESLLTNPIEALFTRETFYAFFSIVNVSPYFSTIYILSQNIPKRFLLGLLERKSWQNSKLTFYDGSSTKSCLKTDQKLLKWKDKVSKNYSKKATK